MQEAPTHVPQARTDTPVLMVGVDGSEGSVDALRWALSEANRVGGRVEAVYVYAIPSETGWYVGGHPGVLPPDRRAVIDSAQRELARAVDRAVGNENAAPVSTLAVADFRAADALTRLSRHADLLVVGAHRKWGLGRVFGSTTSAVLRAATCPVVVIPPGATDTPWSGGELVPAS